MHLKLSVTYTYCMVSTRHFSNILLLHFVNSILNLNLLKNLNLDSEEDNIYDYLFCYYMFSVQICYLLNQTFHIITDLSATSTYILIAQFTYKSNLRFQCILSPL